MLYFTCDRFFSVENWTAVLPEHCVTHVGRVLVSHDCASTSNCTQHGWAAAGKDCQSHVIVNAVPDVFLLSCILFLGTFSVAYFLKTFRTSAYFPTQVRYSYLLVTKSHPLAVWSVSLECNVNIYLSKNSGSKHT